MNLDFLIRPVKLGLPSQIVPVFHVPESLFDIHQASIGRDNLRGEPILSVRNKKSPSQARGR